MVVREELGLCCVRSNDNFLQDRASARMRAKTRWRDDYSSAVSGMVEKQAAILLKSHHKGFTTAPLTTALPLIGISRILIVPGAFSEIGQEKVATR